MANRLKEDEKNERIIRNLLKLPENRKCINCNSLGPQYVCTNFWTFICTNCSGIHREFSHRVKSISMAKFTSQEVSSLQRGGNVSMKEIYLKEWDPQRNSLPDGSNVERLRNFIKHVYVDRRYTGEKSFDKPSRARMGETEETNEDRRLDTYQGGSRSPPFEERLGGRYSDRNGSGGTSPGYNQEKQKQGDFRRSPARPEIINDWRRGDRFGPETKSDEGRVSDGGLKSAGRLPDLQKDLNVSSPPEVRPMRDILGDNLIPLRVIEPPKTESSNSLDGIVRNQRTASTSSLASSNGNPAELKTETSLIDFDAIPEPPVTVSVSQTQQSVTSVPVLEQKAPSVVDSWADFDAVPEAKASQSSSITNPLDLVLSGLSISTSVSGGGDPFMVTPVDNAAFISVSASPVMSQSAGFALGGIPAAANPAPVPALPANNGFANATSGGQFVNVQQAQVHSIPSGIGSQPFAATFGGPPTNNQQLELLVPQNAQGPLHTPVVLPSPQGMMTAPALKVTPEAGGRKELPEDLFMSAFPSWQTGTQYGSAVNLQYNMQMPLSTPLQPLISVNPFDVGNERPSVQATTFPSMTSVQGALPNMDFPTNLLPDSSNGIHLSTWNAQQPSHAPSYSSVLPGAYLGQGNMPLSPQGIDGLGFEGSAFGAINLNQQPGGFYSAQANHNTSSSIGGNPFG